jgi:hypothetical protein
VDVGTQAVTVSPVESVRVSLWPSTVTIAQFWPAAGAWLPPAGGFAAGVPTVTLVDWLGGMEAPGSGGGGGAGYAG